MKGKLYLASHYELDVIPSNINIINIARKDMSGVNDKRISLAPSRELFNWYMNNKNNVNGFDDYEKVYMNQLKNNKYALNELSSIKNMLESGKDVCLLCFCRNINTCHRSLIGRLFKNKGFDVISF